MSLITSERYMSRLIEKNDYITGKKGIGPFALNVTNHELARLYQLKFKDVDTLRKIGLDRPDKLFDNNGNPIASWMSGFINAHVDIVKDPWISETKCQSVYL